MKLEFLPVPHLPEVAAGMNLPVLLSDALRISEYQVQTQDILAVTQKIVSKAEGRIVHLATIEPSRESVSIARRIKKDPRLIEVILRESRRIVRLRGDVLVCETHHGFICANAGVDQSNVEGENVVTVLPKDPDRSARHIARVLGCGVIVTDTFGRVWREGLVDVAIGIAGVPPFIDFRGRHDSSGHVLNATLLAAVDSLAASAGLVMGKLSRTPAALIRGFAWSPGDSGVELLLRPAERNLFL